MRAATFPAGLGLASLSGCLWFLACTPFDLAALAWIASLPMLLAIDRAPTVRRAMLLGWWSGVVETGGGFYWIIDLTQRFAGFHWLAGAGVLLLFCALRGLIFVLFAAVVAVARRRASAPMMLVAPLAMVASEWLVPQIFPCGQWITQAWHPLIIQITDLTGPYGVTALLLLVSGALYDAGSALTVTPSLGHAWRLPALRALPALPALRGVLAPLGWAVLVLGAALAYGALRMQSVDALRARMPVLRVGLVQPNIAYTSDGEITPDEAVHELTTLQDESQRLQQAGAELIVWSEGAYPVPLPWQLGIDYPPDSPARLRRDLKVPLLAGTSTYDPVHDRYYNSALLFERQGRVTGHYDKVELLAFGEYVPGIDWFPWLRNVLPAGAGGYTRGEGPKALTLAGGPGPTFSLGPLICYEDILPDYIRDVGRQHPNLLVNLTVDSWYGARAEPFEHLALAVFGSVAVRADMVRAVNSGVSALIDANGRLRARTDVDDPYLHPRPAQGLVVTAARMPGGDTLYVRFGDWFAGLATLGCGVLVLRGRRVGRSVSD